MFYQKLLKIVIENSENSFTDNFDTNRYGNEDNIATNTAWTLNEITPYLPKLNLFHDLLEDDFSKEYLVKLTAFRLLGHRKIKLPLSNKRYWDSIEKMKILFDKDKKISIPFLDNSRFYSFIDLNVFDINVKVYSSPNGIATQFILKQYEYITEQKEIVGAIKGDTVLDCGACFGDTTLFFANQVGNSGKVFSFEFIPENLAVIDKNFALNQQLKKNIKIIKNPVWSESNKVMYCKHNGPGSRVSLEKFENYDSEVSTISIDDLIEKEKLESVNLIKMDIEGAEPYALKGAEKTIVKFKPKLAISIYHNMSDFSNIVHYLNDLDVGYKFYLDHFTIHKEETVLFAMAG